MRKAKKVSTSKEGDPNRGEQLFRSICAGCHALSQMKGIYMKPIAAGAYATSALSTKADQRWTMENLDRFLRAPKEFAPETAMGAVAVKNNRDRRDIIEFLKGPYE